MKIHEYAKQGDITGVARELAAGVAINAVETYTTNAPLACAVAEPTVGLDMLHFLVENGAQVDSMVFCRAVRYGSLNAIQLLLEAGADINCKEGDCDVLTLAAYSRSSLTDDSLIPVLRLLIEHGAGLHHVSQYGESALKVASNAGRFDAVAFLLNAGADPSQLQWTELMRAVAVSNIADIQALLIEGADLTTRDSWHRTPWLLGMQTGDLRKAQLLLAAGSDRNACGNCGNTPLMYAIKSGRIEMLEWLIAEGFNVNASDDFGGTALEMAVEQSAVDGVRVLLQAGACKQNLIREASELRIVRMLLAVGADLSDISDEGRAALTGMEAGEENEVEATPEQYQEGKFRQFGTSNPQRMDIPFWRAMVRSGARAYRARAAFATAKSEQEPVWCYQRFGRSITELPDGRIVEIGGEHEDFYDDDFCIYNDVVIFDGKGDFEILGYPEAVFPPTDFHTATLAGNSIFIIGCVGYMHERRPAETPVYRLYLDSRKIVKVNTTGDKPGWIGRLKARYEPPGSIYITGGKVCTKQDGKEKWTANTTTYVLDLTNFRWSRL